MNYHYIGREPTPDEKWESRDLMPTRAERRKFPGLHFVRLANLSNMSLLLTTAYETRLQPDTADHPQQLFDQLRSLSPEDLGRFFALEQANTMHFIVSKALSEPDKPPRLTVLGWPGAIRQIAPAVESCDAYGQPLNILRPGTTPYKKALWFSEVVDQLIEKSLEISSTDRESRNDAFRGAWGEAGREMLAAAEVRHEEIKATGPDPANLTKTVTFNEPPFYEQFYGEQPPQMP